jgi:hypothetical protein
MAPAPGAEPVVALPRDLRELHVGGDIGRDEALLLGVAQQGPESVEFSEDGARRDLVQPLVPEALDLGGGHGPGVPLGPEGREDRASE